MIERKITIAAIKKINYTEVSGFLGCPINLLLILTFIHRRFRYSRTSISKALLFTLGKEGLNYMLYLLGLFVLINLF